MVRPAARRPRSYDPGKVRTALAAQTEALRAAVRELCADPAAERLLAAPTRLGEWRVRELLAHLDGQLSWLPRHIGDLPAGGEPLALTAWVARSGGRAGQLDANALSYAADWYSGSPEQLAARFDAAAEELLGFLDGPEVADGQRRLAVQSDSMTLADLLVTRLLEAVVHADDLAAALELPAFPHDRFALASTSRLLADAFADQVPGGAVELRIPPYAVVQAVPGPRHTRGTPPNVVETDPLSWIRLATGRLDWAAAVDRAQVSASGERSDLSGYLPVLR
ncbi:sterol carrier family protein [Kitasatospora sp. NPDC052896]|uniref:sterol carrier family protein n=1 Tax=Kitasatospora sp. NPDC052896 TaxID=3364061 RepID=UPI0037C60C00